MSFLYPRIISVSRPNAATANGIRPYEGVTESGETAIASGVAANIGLDRQGTAPTSKLAADAAGESIWRVVFKAPLGQVRTGDVIADEIGNRYQVVAADWNPLNTECRCQILQT